MAAKTKTSELVPPLTRVEWLLQLCGVVALIYIVLTALGA